MKQYFKVMRKENCCAEKKEFSGSCFAERNLNQGGVLYWKYSKKEGNLIGTETNHL